MIGNKKKLRFVTRGVWWWRYPENSIQLLYECHRKLKRGIAAPVGRDVEIDDDDEKSSCMATARRTWDCKYFTCF